MKNKLLIIIFFISNLLLFSIIIGINYYIDPMWISSHKNKYNSFQISFNERLTKSIALKYNARFSNCDTMLIGSSRGTYLNVNNFKDINVFNYSFSSARIKEYPKYINFAVKENAGIKNIILALDFWQLYEITNIQLEKQKPFKKLKYNKLFFILKTYSLYSVLKRSNNNYKKAMSKKTGARVYNRDLIVKVDKVTQSVVKSRAKKRSKSYHNNVKEYSNYKQLLLNIKELNLNFTVYTTPLSKPFLRKIQNTPHLRKAYYDWINDMVLVFGKIYFFTMPSYYSKNYSIISKDGDHYYPDSLEILTNIIEDKKSIEGYGLIITKENLENELNKIKKSYN